MHSDSRHYNAWYGLGVIAYRQEKYAIAEGHFHKGYPFFRAGTVLFKIGQANYIFNGFNGL